MVRLTKIYTRGGDGGETSLGGGARVLKCDPRVEAYGAVDEANAAIEALNGYELGGRALKINEARPREERPRRDKW